MSGSTERAIAALSHRVPDRTPLFEMFQPYHPIHWPICGRTVATDEALCWDALAEGISWEELTEADARAYYAIHRHFELDLVHIPPERPRPLPRPRIEGPGRWELDGQVYVVHPRTQMVVLEEAPQELADSRKISEGQRRREIATWDGAIAPADPAPPLVLTRVRELAAAEGLDWCWVGEVGAGTGVAFYPPFQLMWFLDEPELIRRYLAMCAAQAFRETRRQIGWGCRVVLMGGDVSSDKGPFISPRLYRELVLPVIQEHISVIHQAGALAIYTSDGNHWPIRDAFFFDSGADGYAEVDKAAGMTMERLLQEGVAERVCILGNVDARHTLCLGGPAEARAETLRCLELGQRAAGGHILHTSHDVHADVRSENYLAMIGAYRDYYGLPPLPR